MTKIIFDYKFQHTVDTITFNTMDCLIISLNSEHGNTTRWCRHYASNIYSIPSSYPV